MELPSHHHITRRAVLKSAAAGMLTIAGGASARAADRRPVWADATLRYLETLAREDGAYAWEDRDESHLTPTFGVVGCYHALGLTPPRKAALAQFIRTHHPFRLKRLERDLWRFELEQVRSLLWLGEDPGPVCEELRRWTEPLVYAARYETHSFPVFQIEAHGQGSPADAVEMARALKIHLWGAKNAQPGWIERAQTLADREHVPVRFFVADEEYGTLVSVPGMGTYSHTSDIIAPAGASFGPSLASAGEVAWEEFRRRRLGPLQKAGGRLVWQFGENEELTRIYLDDSLRRGGYAALSTFHFGNPDFANSEPFLYQYRGRIPFVALQDAHGTEPWWWGDMTTGFRTLFLAEEPTWEGWLEALRRNWTVAVRHDAVSAGKTWMHGGSREVLQFVRQHDSQWRWWDNPQIVRAPVSLVALGPDDEFEAGRPERGINLRVRCQWENGASANLKAPVVELVALTLDGRPVEPELVKKKGQKGALVDQYHLHRIPTTSPGKHTATVTVRTIATGAASTRTVEFQT